MSAETRLPRGKGQLGRVVLGDDRVQRLRMKQALLALALVMGCGLVGLWAAQQAGTPLPAVLLWLGVLVCGQFLLVGLIRSGWSLGLADPALTIPQIVFTLALTATIYTMLGDMRSGALPVCLLILCFGMFQLSSRQVVRMAMFTLALLGLTMLANQRIQAHPPPLVNEVAHWLIMGISVWGVSLLSMRLSAIRGRLKHQREELAQALARIEELAIRDGLTGLYNRRHGESLLREALERHARGDAGFQLLLADLDHFKRVNDAHGHAMGDQVLRAFALGLQDALRSTDVAVRWGGEEFLVLLRGWDWETPLARLQVNAAAAALELEGGERLHFTFSGGLAASRVGESAEALLERADAALYRAKALGRNRVEQG